MKYKVQFYDPNFDKKCNQETTLRNGTINIPDEFGYTEESARKAIEEYFSKDGMSLVYLERDYDAD